MIETTLTLRDCEPRDIEAIAEIYRHAVLFGLATFEIEPPDAAEMLRRRTAILAGNYPYLVAEADGAVAGYAYASLYRARPAYRTTVEDSVYIREGLHGRGIGRRLLDRLVEATAARGFRQMIAVIGDSANTASVRLHAAAGFERVGTHRAVGWKHGRWVDTVMMQRGLGAGDGAPA